MKPTSSPIDITNQKRGLAGSAANGMRDFSAITVGTIPAISRFIDSSSAMNVLRSERRYEPPTMSRMNSAWKIVQPKAKPRMYSTATSTKPARPKTLEVVVEYILGFAFGWTIFQALFMRDMVG